MVTENDADTTVDQEKAPKAASKGRKSKAVETVTEAATAAVADEGGGEKVKKPVRRRAPAKKSKPVPAVEETGVGEAPPAEAETKASTGASSDGEVAVKAPRKRSPRKRKARVQPVGEDTAPAVDAAEPTDVAEPIVQKAVAPVDGADAVEQPSPTAEGESAAPPKPTQRKNRRSRKSSGKGREKTPPTEVGDEAQEDAPVTQPSSAGRKRRRPEPRQEPRQEDPEAADGDWRDEDLADEEEWDSNYDTNEQDEDIPLLDDEPEEQVKRVSKLLINAEEPEECRLALLENGRLESIHVSTVTKAQNKNNIYKARIVAIEANLQAAFVDYGTDKNGFLPFSEIHPEYYKDGLSAEVQKLVDAHNWKRLSITDVMEKNQEVLVQVVKEEVGKKGANMTTYLSLPGRCVVLMPGSDSSGISRRIVGEERRSQLRNAMNEMEIPEGIGWIVRTASVDITKAALARDVGYLLRLWEEIKKKGQTLEGIGQLYEDHQSVLRFLREHFDPSIEEILVDDQEAYEQVKEFVALLPENQQNVKVRLHKGSRPIFNQFSVEDQIESIYQPKVNLPSGGSIVIDPTEALVAIDVNSGSTSRGKNFEATIFQANMEAAVELTRQLRLRDLGGLIVIDFIDMRSKKNIREVERQVKVAMKRDKAKVDISRISKFGLMQISRQKLGAPIESGNYQVCQHCKGRGLVRSIETLALFYLRRIQTGASRKNVVRVECHFPLDVAQYLLNNKRREVYELEEKYAAEIAIIVETAMKPADHEILFHKAEKEHIDKKQA